MLAAASLSVPLAAAVVAGAPGAADAACYGTAYTVTGYVDGHLIAQESAQYASTCDDDGQYRGHVYDMYTDGSCVSVYFWNPGKIREARSCDSAGTLYTFDDVDGAGSNVLWDMCTTYWCRYLSANGDNTYMYGY